MDSSSVVEGADVFAREDGAIAPTPRLSRVDGPDFICIGMPKAGTAWLYDQLQFHADFWMPPVKEMHYLTKDYSNMGNYSRRLERARPAEKSARRERKLAERNLLPRRRSQNDRDTRFLEEAMELAGKPRDFDGYAALFRYKDGLLSGDITPAYAQLSPETIERIAARFPDTKIIFMVRDPVAREWSHLCMTHRSKKRNAFDLSQFETADRFRELLTNSTKLETRNKPTEVLALWRKHAPKMPFRHYLFDELVEDADKLRRDMITYIGGDPDKPSAVLSADYNRKSSASKLPLTDVCKDVLVDFFKDELKACAEAFGAHAKQWPVRYGL
jgi:hypothetical protein